MPPTDRPLEPHDDDIPMPCAEALLASTLTLMTSHAQSACERQRGLVSRKIASNLFFLQSHPGVSTDFRALLGTLRARWARQALPIAGTPSHVWLQQPHALQ